MPDLPLSLRCTKTGTVYVDGPLTANGWDNSALGGARGVLVLGTEDAGRAQVHADAAVRHFFGPTVTARPQPGPTRWRLFSTSDNPDELEWRPDQDATQHAVLFTAEVSKGLALVPEGRDTSCSAGTSGGSSTVGFLTSSLVAGVRGWHTPEAPNFRTSRGRDMTPPASAAGGASKPRRPRTSTTKAPPAPARRGRHGSEGEPKHKQLMRRDIGLWPDQVADLLALRDQVNHARTQRDERITDATLVRVAVDLLSEFREHLAGNTEDELRDSVVELARELFSHPTTVQRAKTAVAAAKTTR